MKAQRFNGKRVVQGLLSFVIWFLAFSPVRATTLRQDTVTESGSNNLIYLPLIRHGNNYYVSPSGDDNNSGTSPLEAWATFDRALNEDTPGNKLQPGDILILMDGVYYQTLQVHKLSGEPGRPITIRAQHDGKAIIDGEGKRLTVELMSSYYIIEGIVAKNSFHTVYKVTGENNVLRRVSGYNANTDKNAHVFTINARNTVLEDCVAAGTGRKMILIFHKENNVIRRCFADWQQWDGREWHDCWPWGDGIEIYNSNYNTIENSISYTRNPTQAINLLAQGATGGSSNNKILGSMAILSGMHEDGVTPYTWEPPRPQPSEYTCVRDLGWSSTRVGFHVYEAATVKDNLWQDIFAWGSAGYGLQWTTGGTPPPNNGGNQIIRATIVNNGLDNVYRNNGGGLGADTSQEVLDKFTLEDSRIDKIYIADVNNQPTFTSLNGEGARLTTRYMDGVLTNEPLWPWPMEERIQKELGISVTKIMTNLIFGTENLDEIYPEVEISTASKKNE